MTVEKVRAFLAIHAPDIEILETDGYDAVQQREVARRAGVSLATIYKNFSSRDELIFRALETCSASLAEWASRRPDSVSPVRPCGPLRSA